MAEKESVKPPGYGGGPVTEELENAAQECATVLGTLCRKPEDYETILFFARNFMQQTTDYLIEFRKAEGHEYREREFLRLVKQTMRMQGEDRPVHDGGVDTRAPRVPRHAEAGGGMPSNKQPVEQRTTPPIEVRFAIYSLEFLGVVILIVLIHKLVQVL